MKIYTPLEKMLPKCPLTKDKKEQHSLRYIQYFFRAVTIIYIVTLKVGLFVLPNSLSLSLSLSPPVFLSPFMIHMYEYKLMLDMCMIKQHCIFYYYIYCKDIFYFKLEEYIWVNFLNIWSSFFPLQIA